MKICILNASNPVNVALEADVYVDHRTGPYFEGNRMLKKCISWHSWSYALKTEFFVYGKDKWQGCFGYDAVIILVNRDMDKLIPLVKKLKLAKKKVAIALHEGGQDFQVGSGLPSENSVQRWVQLVDLVKEADKYITFLPQITPFFEGLFGESKVSAVLHTAPFDWKHTFKKPYEGRKYDILIGTRTLNQRLSRNTLMVLGAMNGLKGYSVHYRSEDGDISDLLARLGITNITVHKGSLSYEDWLQFISDFRCMVHFDHSLNLGQIALDGLMVDVECIGSTTANAHASGYADNGSLEVLISDVKKYLEDRDFRYPYNELGRCLQEIVDIEEIKFSLLEVFE
jgi:hypothetical protein